MPIVVLLILTDGELLTQREDCLWFTPEFMHGYQLKPLACSTETSIALTPSEYIFENETLKGDELRALLDLVVGRFVEHVQELNRAKKLTGLPPLFAGNAQNRMDYFALSVGTEVWRLSYLLIQNSQNLEVMMGLIENGKYYALSLEDDDLSI